MNFQADTRYRTRTYRSEQIPQRTQSTPRCRARSMSCMQGGTPHIRRYFSLDRDRLSCSCSRKRFLPFPRWPQKTYGSYIQGTRLWRAQNIACNSYDKLRNVWDIIISLPKQVLVFLFK
jgi:hypothetical protein